jgi:hypothetical protein
MPRTTSKPNRERLAGRTTRNPVSATRPLPRERLRCRRDSAGPDKRVATSADPRASPDRTSVLPRHPTCRRLRPVRSGFGVGARVSASLRASPVPFRRNAPKSLPPAPGQVPSSPESVLREVHPRPTPWLAIRKSPSTWSETRVKRTRLQGFEPRESPCIHSARCYPDGRSRSSPGFSSPWGVPPSCHGHTGCAASSHALGLRGHRSGRVVCASESQ